MYDADAIEALNFDQLATATDRMLVRGGHVSRHRPRTLSRVDGSPSSRAVSRVRSAPQPAHRSHVSHVHFERTVIIRPLAGTRTHVFAVTVVIPTLVGIVVGLAALL